MGDKFYVLCEFINEDKNDDEGADRPCQVAYAEWITNRNKNVPLSTLIEKGTQVSLRWPKNRDVQPKECMVKKCEGIEWMDVVAILKGQHDSWPEIVTASKNLVKYGIPFPTKQQRREFSRNTTDSGASNKPKRKASDGGKGQNGMKKPRVGMKPKKDSKGVSSKAVPAKTKDTVIIGDSSDTDSSDDDTPLDNIRRTPSTTGSCFNNYLDSYSKAELMAKVQFLEKRNLELEEQVKHYKNMKSVAEEFPKLASRMKELLAQSGRSSSRHESSKHRSESHHGHARKDRGGNGSHNSESHRCGIANQTSSDRRESSKVSNSMRQSPSDLFTNPHIVGNHSRTISEIKKSKEPSSSSALTTDPPKKKLPAEKETAATPTKYCQQKLQLYLAPAAAGRPEKSIIASKSVQQPEKSIVIDDGDESVNEGDDRNAFELGDIDLKDELHDENLPEDASASPATEQQNEPKTPQIEQMVFGNRSVPKARVLKLRHNKHTILAGELLGLIFTSEELALRTLKGGNRQKIKKEEAGKGNENNEPDLRLDVETVDAIVEYVIKALRKSGDSVKAEIDKAMTNKLNNFKKTPEGKLIIARHKGITEDSTKPPSP